MNLSLHQRPASWDPEADILSSSCLRTLGRDMLPPDGPRHGLQLEEMLHMLRHTPSGGLKIPQAPAGVLQVLRHGRWQQVRNLLR